MSEAKLFILGGVIVVVALWLYLVVNNYCERDKYDRIDEDGEDK